MAAALLLHRHAGQPLAPSGAAGAGGDRRNAKLHDDDAWRTRCCLPEVVPGDPETAAFGALSPPPLRMGACLGLRDARRTSTVAFPWAAVADGLPPVLQEKLLELGQFAKE